MTGDVKRVPAAIIGSPRELYNEAPVEVIQGALIYFCSQLAIAAAACARFNAFVEPGAAAEES